MVSQATGGLGGLLGGSGEYTRYLAILTSRSMMEDVVERFDLIRVYGIEDGPGALEDAVDRLRENVEFEVSAAAGARGRPRRWPWRTSLRR